MKKLALCLIVAAAMMMVPFSAFGLQMMNNNSMDQVTGQAGVAIAFDDVQVFINVDRFSYMDADGLGTDLGWGSTLSSTDRGAAFNVNNFQIDTLKANAIIATLGLTTGHFSGATVGSMGLHSVYQGIGNLMPLQFNYANTSAFAVQTTANPQSVGLNHLYDSKSTWRPQAISIDITNSAPAVTEGFNYIATSGSSTAGALRIAAVTITLPTAEFYMDNINIPSMTLTDNLSLAGAAFVGTPSLNSGDSFGGMEMEGVTFTLLKGWIEIAPHN